MDRFLVVYAANTGFAEISNIGFFDADSEEDAKEMARKQWHTTAKLEAIPMEELFSGWSFYQ